MGEIIVFEKCFAYLFCFAYNKTRCRKEHSVFAERYGGDMADEKFYGDDDRDIFSPRSNVITEDEIRRPEGMAKDVLPGTESRTPDSEPEEKISAEEVRESEADEMGEAPVVYQERKRWRFFGLPFTFTKYIIREEVISFDTGFFTTIENDCYMYKVQDVQHSATLLEKMFKLGTVICHTGDKTHPKMVMEHIKHSKEIKNYILKQSEKARIKRRTVNMQNIGANDFDDDVEE